MEQRESYSKRLRWSNIFRVLIYVFFVLIILYFLPKEGKFKYEYQKGKPWQHENLIAPFDFAIYKTPEALELEKDELIKNSKQYFNKDSVVQITNIKNFVSTYNKLMREYVGVSDTIIDTLSVSNNIFHNLKITIANALAEIYACGLIDSELMFNGDESNDRIILIKDGNITVQKLFTEVFTIKTAYLYVKNCMRNFMSMSAGKMSELEFKKIEKIVEGLNPNQWLEQNILYDEATTQKVLNESIKNISPTNGFVQHGQRIIFQGEMVYEEEFRILESLRREYEQSNHSSNFSLTLLGQALVFSLFFVLIYWFLKTFRPQIFHATKYSVLILSIMTVIIVTMSLVIRYNLFNFWVVPFLLLALIIKTFFDTRVALFFHIMTCVATAFVVPNSFEYFVMQFIPGYFIIITLQQINRRGLVFLTSIICFLLYALVYLSFEFMYNGSLSETNWHTLLYLFYNSLLLLLASPTIFIFEKVFNLLSDSTLMELTDFNRPLLQRFSSEASGSFQHCTQVANLAEAAIRKIGGNTHLVRAGALYHDIGKIEAPLYFTENQIQNINLHDQLDDELKSAEIIKNHVKNGVKLGKEYNLPSQVIDFIKTHHGTTKLGSLYPKYKEKHPDEDCEALFEYPGPRPSTKEQAVVMMADSVEAASKSLKNFDKETFSNLVEKIINSKVQAKQFDDTNLTFKDIDTIKQVFVDKLQAIYKGRIAYPNSK